jgi:hypothetical protein
MGSFESIWYWALTLVLWSRASTTVLGVPYDMILRARRTPSVVARVEALAHLSSDRIGGLYDRGGGTIAAATGFALAVLLGVALATQVELPAAAFALLFPLAIVAYSTLRLAPAVRRQRMAGERLVHVLGKRRRWHMAIGMIAILGAVSVGMIYHQGLP